MTHILIGAVVALALLIAPAGAQAPPSPASPTAAYLSAYQAYALVAPTPGDAYKQGLINRWQLEQLQGPTPQALQGPSPDGGNAGGGGSRGGN